MAVETERVPALDGLRGLAILMVLVLHIVPYHHATTIAGKAFNGLTGMGWSGVDLFFVLSGFLIPGILIQARKSTHYFRNFYARRTLRIFPLYYLIVFISVVIGPWLFPGISTKPAAWAGWWWLYLSNIPYSIHPLADPGWLNVFWSLAVEEHFYLIWPAVVLFCSDRSLVRVCVALVCVAWLCRAACDYFGFLQAGYALTPCRMDALAYGGLVAVFVRSPSRRRYAGSARVAACGLGVIALLILIWRHSVFFDRVTQLVTMPLIDLFFAWTVLAVVTSQSGGPALLRFRPLRLLGKYSYGIYVFHIPVSVLLGPKIAPLISRISSVGHADDVCLFLLISSGSIAVAFVSWHLFEMPFIRLKRYFPQSHAMPAADLDR